jgi:lipopolysaccharide heptosyltransferase II
MNQQDSPKILVKLPVKMGDTIMAAYFLRAVKDLYPNCRLDVIMAKGLQELAAFMPYVDHVYEFSKKEYSGPLGNYRYGKLLAGKENYDLLFCLPFSFSSALASYFTGAKVRIGYNTEHRAILLTKTIKRPGGLHIVEEFNHLLEEYSGKKIEFAPLGFKPEIDSAFALSDNRKLVLNIKSGPPSRSIPVHKGISLVGSFLDIFPHDIILTGAPNETDYISKVKDAYEQDDRVINLAGKTSITQLAYVISLAECMVTTDSGNAHIANAVGTPTVVLFGAAHEHRARPYDTSISRILKLTDMECVPCESEHCKYGDNRCLANIDNAAIISAMKELME